MARPPTSPDLALMKAAWTGDAELLRAVLDLGVADLEVRGEQGNTGEAGQDGYTASFLWVCNSGLAESIGVLAEAGCDKDAATDNGSTALMLAAFSGNVAAVRAVLALGVVDKVKRDKRNRPATRRSCWPVRRGRRSAPVCLRRRGTTRTLRQTTDTRR